MKRTNQKQRKWRKMERRGLVGFLMAAILVTLMCSYGHAAMGRDLYISGEGAVAERNAVRMTGIRLVSLSSGAEEMYAPKVADDATSMFLKLPIGGSAVYELSMANDTSHYQALTSITEQVEAVGLQYEIVGERKFLGVDRGSTKSFQIKVTNVSGAEQQAALLLDYGFSEELVGAPVLAISTTDWTSKAVNVSVRTTGTATSEVDYYEYKMVTTNGGNKTETTGETAGPLAVATNGTNVIQYRTVSKYGARSAWSTAVTAKYDDVVPQVTMLANGVYTNNDVRDFATATYGPSGGAVTCEDNYGNAASKVSTLHVLGAVTVNCTAKSKAGKSSAEVSGSYTRNVSFTGADSTIRCIDNSYTKSCTRSGNVMTLPFGYTQFGPYIKADVGCYYVEYRGTNFNAANMRISVYWSNLAGYTARSLSVSSTRITYYIYIPSVSNQLEITLLNAGNANLTISSVKMTKVNTCPAS